MIANATVMLFAAVNVVFGVTCLLMGKEIRDLWYRVGILQEAFGNIVESLKSMEPTLKNIKESVALMFDLDQSTMQELDNLQKDFAHMAEISGQRIGNLENQLTVLKRKLEKEKSDETDD